VITTWFIFFALLTRPSIVVVLFHPFIQLVFDSLLIVDDFFSEFAKILNPLIDADGVMFEEFEQSRKNPPVGSMYLIDVLQFLHFREREAQVFESLDEFQPLVIPICIDSLSPLHPLYRIEKADFLVVADRSSGESNPMSQFADLVMH